MPGDMGAGGRGAGGMGMVTTGSGMMGAPAKAALGITINLDDDPAPVEGVAIVGLMPGGPADTAGLKPDDLITGINGQGFAAPTRGEGNQKLLRFMAAVDPGADLKVAYRRAGKPGTAQVRPGAMPPMAMGEAMGPMGPGMGMAMGMGRGMHGMPGGMGGLDGMQGAFAGLRLVEVSEGLGRYFGTKSGLLVVKHPSALEIPLEDGDVILTIAGRTPEDRMHADRILGSYRADEKITLEVMREKKKKELSFAVPATPMSALPMPGAMPMMESMPVPGR